MSDTTDLRAKAAAAIAFRIERRGDHVVLVEDSGGIRPATTHEQALWDALADANELRALLDEARTGLIEAFGDLNLVDRIDDTLRAAYQPSAGTEPTTVRDPQAIRAAMEDTVA